MIKILVTGANGQMGQVLRSISSEFPTFEFIFLSSQELDVTSLESCDNAFVKNSPDICFNFAAYTNVEKAEDEEEIAFGVNALGCKNIAKTCLKFDVSLVHLSTDFVFDGEKKEPYLITDSPNPINVYGASKLKGEHYIQELMTNYYIVRTSWVYSNFGHNFKNTMLRLSETKSEISVVDDQIGCPTNAVDVCYFIMSLIDKHVFGLYHFRGDRICSWYDFAVSIFKEENITIKVHPISSEEYSSKVKRPRYSVLG